MGAIVTQLSIWHHSVLLISDQQKVLTPAGKRKLRSRLVGIAIHEHQCPVKKFIFCVMEASRDVFALLATTSLCTCQTSSVSLTRRPTFRLAKATLSLCRWLSLPVNLWNTGSSSQWPEGGREIPWSIGYQAPIHSLRRKNGTKSLVNALCSKSSSITPFRVSQSGSDARKVKAPRLKQGGFWRDILVYPNSVGNSRKGVQDHGLSRLVEFLLLRSMSQSTKITITNRHIYQITNDIL